MGTFGAAALEEKRTMPIAEFNGVQLHFQRSGAGEPLVLVHGSWVDGEVWSGVLPLLARSFEVVAYDRRGHSRSSCPPGQGSVRDDVDDLASLIESLDLGPAHVAGASMGGSIALRLAAARPELLRSVTVHEPPLFDLLDAEEPDLPELSELRRRLAAVGERLAAGDMEGGARLYFDQVADTPGGWEGLDPRRRRLLLSNAPTYLDQCRDPDALGIDTEDLDAFGGPALLTYGNRRPPLFRRIVEMVVAAMPGARSEAIPGATHDPQVTHPGPYAQLIESHITATVARR
jgi:pimeloyl-ACP methyl ester carboxylesterase